MHTAASKAKHLREAAPRKLRHGLFRLAFYILLSSLAFVFLYPFIIMIVDSLKTENDLINITVKWLPSRFQIENYQVAYMKLNFGKYVWNSLLVALCCTAGHIFSASMTGYAFARYRFRGKSLLFGIVILAMIVPIQVIIFPLYMQYSNWNWINTFKPLIIPTFFGFGLSGGFFIFLFRQFFSSLPYEMEEAARIDGCGALRTYFRIMLPMAQSSMLVCGLLSMVWHWNDYFEPNVYISTYDLYMLPSRLPALYSLLNSENFDTIRINNIEGVMFNEAMLMAATFLCILPILIVYAILQRRFMEGVERSGLTGL